MRTTKELLKIMLGLVEKSTDGDDNIRGQMYLANDPGTSVKWSGLCHFITAMETFDIISYKEKNILKLYFGTFLPAPYRPSSGYSWPPGIKEPRIKWLKEQINKLCLDT